MSRLLQVISILQGSEITIEIMPVSEKIEAIRGKKEHLPNKPLDQCSFETQKEILSSIEPTGPWRVEVVQGARKVTALNIFNPL